MAVNPINISRISHNLQANHMISTLRQNQTSLFTAQSQIASGRTYVTPSENPVAAARALDLTQVLGRQEQFILNLNHGDSMLTAADTAITEVNSLLIEASAVASQNVSNLTSAGERQAEAEIIAGIREQLLVVGNRQFDGRYIFAGRDTTEPPFRNDFGGVIYTGDTGDLVTRISEEFSAVTNVPGNVLFGALSARIASDADLTPSLTPDLRLEDIQGTRGEPIRGGTLVITEFDGAGVVRVDLESVDTIGDVVDQINFAATDAGAGFTASLTDTGIRITPQGNQITVSDANGGVVASNLGVLANTPTTAAIDGLALVPRVSRLTPVENLSGGDGIDLVSGLIITNGGVTETIDLSTVATVQDIINTINNSDAGVVARVNDAGTGIDVFNQVSGTSLTIGENGGTTAADLGIRTMDTATPLSSLNFGRGLDASVDRADFQITARNGSIVDVDVNGANTVGDVIDLINLSADDAGVAIDAAFAGTGNGIRITDNTGGTDPLSVTAVGTSLVAYDLGIAQTIDDGSNEIIGNDTNPTRTEGILAALVDLENALRNDDTRAITEAGERIDTFVPEVTRVHGIVGAQSQAMQAKLRQTQDAAQTTEIFLSEVRDLDFAEAATRLQSFITQLQASFQASSIVSNLSLLNFLR